MPTKNDKRAVFRYRYKFGYYAVTDIANCKYSVLDVSENAVKFRNPNHDKMPHCPFNVDIHFMNKKVLHLTVKKTRNDAEDVVTLMFQKPIPFTELSAEEIYVKKYIAPISRNDFSEQHQ
jgi:hypothetical protein